jgi:hypothetical protein
MSQKDDYQKLAGQFMDMWQKNMAAMMNDSEFIRAFLQMMQASSFSAKDNASYGNAPPNPADASPAPDARDAAIAGLKVSLATVEKRLGALEHALAGLISALAEKTPGRMANAAKRPGTRKGSGKGSPKKSG